MGAFYKSGVLLFLVSTLPCLAMGNGWPVSGNTYIGLDGASVSVQGATDQNLNPRGARLRFGFQVNELLDIETHLGGGVERQPGAPDLFSTTYTGVYLKTYLPVGRRSSIFGLAGLSGVSHTQRLDGRSFNTRQSGFSYGFGMESKISRRLDLSADFMRYSSEGLEFSDVTAFSFGIKWYF